jgi:hypothetical protein
MKKDMCMYLETKASFGANPLFLHFLVTRFFDNYVIPLAKKLKECQVFGAASDECLNYAISNRCEWKEKGEQVVAEFIGSVITAE